MPNMKAHGVGEARTALNERMDEHAQFQDQCGNTPHLKNDIPQKEEEATAHAIFCAGEMDVIIHRQRSKRQVCPAAIAVSATQCIAQHLSSPQHTDFVSYDHYVGRVGHTCLHRYRSAQSKY
jgi:hypothetical protein